MDSSSRGDTCRINSSNRRIGPVRQAREADAEVVAVVRAQASHREQQEVVQARTEEAEVVGEVARMLVHENSSRHLHLLHLPQRLQAQARRIVHHVPQRRAPTRIRVRVLVQVGDPAQQQERGKEGNISAGRHLPHVARTSKVRRSPGADCLVGGTMMMRSMLRGSRRSRRRSRIWRQKRHRVRRRA